MSELTHFDERGASRMVDTSDKPETHRLARASACVRMAPATIALIRNRRYILPALTAPFRSPPGPSLAEAPLGPQIERIEQDDRPVDASAAAAGYSPPRTRS